MADEKTLILVAKVPTRGKSKTRLIPGLGEDGALAVARALLIDTLRRFGSLADEWRRVLYYAPSASTAAMQSLVREAGVDEAWELMAMPEHDLCSSDLGALLKWAQEKVAAKGIVVYVGMDAPDLPEKAIVRAVDHALRGQLLVHDATDGGYVLCALPAGTSGAVFDEVEWSSPRTAESQRERAVALGLKLAPFSQEDAWFDVDDLADLSALHSRLLQNSQGLCPELELLLPRLLLLPSCSPGKIM